MNNNTIAILIALLFCGYIANSQTANDFVLPYDGKFRPASNIGFIPPFSEIDLANLAAGNDDLNVKGVGVKSFRPALTEFFMEEYGYDFFLSNFQHYESVDLKENTVIVGFPTESHQDPNFYCNGIRSELFTNLYMDIWDNGENGTPINDENYYARYIYNMVTNYKDYVKFWEIWNEPGFDFTGAKGWLGPDQPGNWWTNNPDPCDYKLRAPIFHYIRILRISYEVIHAVDPEAYVTVSGVGYPSFLDAILRNTDNPSGGTVTADYPLGGGAYFDVIGFHSYPHFDGSLKAWSNDIQDFVYFRHSDAAADGILNAQEELKAVLDNYGYDDSVFPSKHWIVTEINVPRKPIADYIGGDEVQRNFLMKSYVQAVKSNFLQLHVYKLAEDKHYDDATDEFEMMGLYKKMDFNNLYFQEPTEEGIGFKTTSDLLFSKNYDAARTTALQLPNNINGAAFYDDFNNYTYVLWAKTTIDESEAANATYNFPSALGINNLLKKEWDFGFTGQSTTISSQNIQLTGAPTFFSERIFESNIQSGCTPLTVNYQSNNFPGAASYTWNFEGGNPSSSSNPAPVVTYNNPGNYEISLEIRNSSGAIITAQTDQIFIQASPTVDFEQSISGPIVVFNNTASTNTSSFFWDFGDGNTSIDANPNHIYDNAGSYNVELTVSNECGTVSTSSTITVDVPDDPVLTTTANNYIQPYDEPFRPGVNPGTYGQQWTDEQIADLSAGNSTEGIQGVGVKALRPFLPEEFQEMWGYEFRVPTYQHYQNLGLEDNTLIIGFPSEAHQEQVFHCPSEQSAMFANMYTDIWDNGENGTPVNDENYFALYLYKTATLYKDYVKFWEIWNEPGFDFTGQRGWLSPGQAGNWWENNPEPCDYKLQAPVFYMIRMLRISYEVIKSVDPDAFITFSGIGFPSFLDAVLRNTDNPNEGAVTGNYPHTGGAYFDVVGFHSYPHFDGSLRYFDYDLGAFVYQRHSDAASEGILQAQNNFKSVLLDYGYDGNTYPEKHWIITEANIPRKSFSGALGGDDPQINYIIKAYIQSMISKILQLHIYKLGEDDYIWEADDEFEMMGLYTKLADINPGFQEANYEGIALKTTSDLLFGTDYDISKTNAMNLPAGVGGGAFIDVEGNYSYVLWAKTTIDNSEVANATYSFPSSFNLIDLYQKNWNYSQTNDQEIISAQGIQLTSRPVFLTEAVNPLPAPLAIFSADVEEGCPPFTVNFNNTSLHAESYLWTFPGGNPATSTSPTPSVTYNQPGSYNVSLQVTNNVDDHIATELNYIFSESQPQSAFNFSVDESDVSFTNNSYNATSYAWDFGDGFTSIGNEPTHNYFTNGTFEVSLAAINECGSASTTQTVTVGTSPIASFKTAFNNACGNFTIFFQDDSAASPTSWNWSFPGGNPSSSTDQNVLVDYNSPGTYDVTLQVTNAFGQDEITEYEYIISETFPQASFATGVDGITATFSNNSTTGANYTWDFGDGTTSSEANPTHIFTSSGSFPVTLTVTNTCGSTTASETITTSVSTAPLAGFTNNISTGCTPLTVQFFNEATTNTTNWNWTFPGGNPATSNVPNPVVTYENAGNFDVSLEVSNDVGSDIQTQSELIAITETPIAAFNFTNTNNTYSFNNNSTGATGYSWNFGDGNVSNAFEPTHTYTQSGTYTVWLAVTNSCGNEFTSSVITIAAAPQAAFDVDINTGCAPFAVTYNDLSAGNATNWFWTFPGGSPSSSTLANPVVNYFAPGEYGATLQVGNSSGNTSVTQSNIVIVEAPPLASFTTFENGLTASFSSDANNADSYEWTFGDGNTSNQQNPVHVYEDAGTYEVWLSVSNDCGTNFASSFVTTTNALTANFSASNTQDCPTFFVQFSDQSFGDISAWNWSFPGGTPSTSSDENPLISYDTPGEYNVSLTVTNGTEDNTFAFDNLIEVLSEPIGNFTYSISSSSVTFDNLSSNATGYFWDFGDGSISTNQNPSHVYAENGTYEVRLTAFNNCSDVIVMETITITDAFAAIFSSDIIEGCAPLTVQYFDMSEPAATTWQWQLNGSSTPVSNEQNPIVTYTEPGVYPVVLNASNGTTTGEAMHPSFIMVYGNPDVDFSETIFGNVVEFTNSTTNGENFIWDFGDGNTSTETNPTHTYMDGGDYLVTLSSSNQCGDVSAVSNITIINTPTASFTTNTTSGCGPLTVQYTNQSSANSNNFQWNFPEGNPSTSTDQNPIVVYENAGIYSASLTVSNVSGTDSYEINDFLLVQNAPIPEFNAAITAAAVNFVNNSAFSESYFWDFGDGFISTAINPFHLYENDGDYVVTLVAINECGNNIYQETISIVTAPSAAFTSNETSGCAPLVIEFIDQSSANTTEWQWSFPGGTPEVSSAQFPSVTYDTPGTYSVSLIASNSVGSIAFIQSNYVNVVSQPEAGFTFSQNGLNFTFLNNSIGGDSYSWDFGDTNTSNLANPSHNFEMDGTYNVILSVNSDCGVSTYEESIVVSTPPVSNFSIQNEENCAPITIEFLNESSNNAVEMEWIFEGGTPATSTDENPTVTYDESGEYNVTLITSNQSGTDTLSIDAFAIIEDVPNSAFSTSITDNQVFFINETENGNFYQWNFGDGESSIDFAPFHIYQNSGDYEVMFIATNPCGADTTIQEITIETTSNDEITTISDIQITPNPNDGKFGLEISGVAKKHIELRLFNILGQVLYFEEINFSSGKLSKQFEMSFLSKGTYLLEVSLDGKKQVKKILIQ